MEAFRSGNPVPTSPSILPTHSQGCSGTCSVVLTRLGKLLSQSCRDPSLDPFTGSGAKYAMPLCVAARMHIWVFHWLRNHLLVFNEGDYTLKLPSALLNLKEIKAVSSSARIWKQLNDIIFGGRYPFHFPERLLKLGLHLGPSQSAPPQESYFVTLMVSVDKDPNPTRPKVCRAKVPF